MKPDIISDMQVAMVSLEDSDTIAPNQSTTEHLEKLEQLCKNFRDVACFEHLTALEFICYVGDDYHLSKIDQSKIPERCKLEAKQAAIDGFRYICFYG